jgi:hypothetical protein
MRTDLNDPVGVHDAVMAGPVERTVGRRLRYVSRESDGSYRGLRERAIVSSMAGWTTSSRMPAKPAPA